MWSGACWRWRRGWNRRGSYQLSRQASPQASTVLQESLYFPKPPLSPHSLRITFSFLLSTPPPTLSRGYHIFTSFRCICEFALSKSNARGVVRCRCSEYCGEKFPRFSFQTKYDNTHPVHQKTGRLKKMHLFCFSPFAFVTFFYSTFWEETQQ